MKLNEGMFAAKLYELEQQYGRMQSRLRLCQQEDHKKIRQELQRASDEYRENELLLKSNVESSRSPAELFQKGKKNPGAGAAGLSPGGSGNTVLKPGGGFGSLRGICH